MELEKNLLQFSYDELGDIFLNAVVSNMIYTGSIETLSSIMAETRENGFFVDFQDQNSTFQKTTKVTYEALYHIFPLTYSDFYLNSSSTDIFTLKARQDALDTMSSFKFDDLKIKKYDETSNDTYLEGTFEIANSKKCSFIFKEGRFYAGESVNGETTYRACLGVGQTKITDKNVLHLSFRGTDQHMSEVTKKDYLHNMEEQYKLLEPLIFMVLKDLESTNTDEIHIGGHSMGASLAYELYSSLSAMNLTNKYGKPIACKCFSFACPGVKQTTLNNTCSYNNNNKVIVINERTDIITKTPSVVKTLKPINKSLRKFFNLIKTFDCMIPKNLNLIKTFDCIIPKNPKLIKIVDSITPKIIKTMITTIGALPENIKNLSNSIEKLDYVTPPNVTQLNNYNYTNSISHWIKNPNILAPHKMSEYLNTLSEHIFYVVDDANKKQLVVPQYLKELYSNFIGVNKQQNVPIVNFGVKKTSTLESIKKIKSIFTKSDSIKNQHSSNTP